MYTDLAANLLLSRGGWNVTESALWADRTEAELFGWSFVLDYLASEDVIKQV